MRLAAAVAGAAIGAALLVWLFSEFAQPALPKSIVMSTGATDGAYHAFAQRYREYLAQYGVDLVLKPSSGSVENLERLRTRSDGVSVALVQGGIAGAADAPNISTLGSLFFEPVWLFWGGKAPFTKISDLHGRRIGVGIAGGGTQALARQLLKAHGIDRNTAQLVETGGLAAVAALESGSIDLAVFVNAPEAPAIQRLMQVPGVQLVGAQRADAYVGRFPFLSKVVLPAGALDVVRDIPAQDQTLIAVTANLLAADDIHPVIVDLLLEAARRVHGNGGLLHRAGEFPAIRDREFPVSPDAERFYRGEYSFLRRYLPFWVAIWVQRFAFFAIPVLAIGLPLVPILPAAYRWRVRSRIYRWYGELGFMEAQVRGGKVDGARILDRLNDIEQRVNLMKVPLAHASEHYTLREHIGLVRQLVASQGQSLK